MGTLDNRVQDWRAKRSGDAGPQPARQWSACAHFAKVFCLIGTFAQITPPARPGHLVGSVSGDRLGKRPWALKENLCHGPSKNIPLWAFLVPYINHSKHSKLFKNVGGKNQTKVAYSKIMVGCSCCSNCTNQPFQVSLLRIAAAAMDSTVKVPPQTWNLGKCIVVPLERCWKMHKKEERSLESRLWNLWNPATMLFYHELSRFSMASCLLTFLQNATRARSWPRCLCSECAQCSQEWQKSWHWQGWIYSGLCGNVKRC